MGYHAGCTGPPACPNPDDGYSFNVTGNYFCQCGKNQCGPYQCAGDSYGKRHQAPKACEFFNKGSTIKIDGETVYKSFGHYITDENDCGKCYLVKSTQTNNKALVMGIDGWAGISPGATTGCSPEMGNTECLKIFGSSCVERQPFKYQEVDCFTGKPS